MNILKINSGKVELRKDSGSLIRTIGNGDAVQADINSKGSNGCFRDKWVLAEKYKLVA